MAERRLIGKIMAYWNVPNEAAREEIELSLMIARQLAVGIARCRTEDALRLVKDRLAIEVEDLKRLHGFSARVMQRTDVEGVLQELMRAAAELAQTGRVSTHVFDGRYDRLQLVGSQGLPAPIDEALRCVGSTSATACGQALQLGRHVVVEDFATDTRFEPFGSLARAWGIRAAHAMPLFEESSAVSAVLTLYYPGPRRPAERELRLLDLHVEVAARQLERKRSEVALAFLAELGAVVTPIGSMTEIARLTGERIREQFGASRVIFSHVSGSLDAISIFHLEGAPFSGTERVLHRFCEYLDSSLIEALRSGRTVAIDDVALDARTAPYAAAYARENVGSLVLAPYLGNGRLTFLLGVHKPAPYRWRARDVAQLEEAAMRVHLRLERARAESALADSEAKLREDDRRKDEFLAMLAHELRNPLAPIVNAVQLLDQRRLDEPAQQNIRAIIGRQVSRLTRLVDDLLEVSRISSGRIQLHRELVDLDTVIERAVETVRPLLEKRRHALELSLPDRPVWVHADATRLEQVVVNLLNNATKYTDEGGRIRLSLAIEDGQAALRIADNGIGIERELLPRIFDLFTQAERSLDRSRGGLGIGLSLVRTLVHMHGGSVSVDSTVGRGSVFTVLLPLATPVAGAEAGSSSEPAAVSIEPLRVLVVDDNVDAALSFRLLLELAGHEVALAHDGAEALEVARQFRPQVGFIDIGLPVLDGYEVARRLRRSATTCDSLLVAVTGYGQQTDRAQASAAGFDHHLVKPVYFTSLQTVLTEASTRRRVH
jgi:signal transduction histidine kinase/ActR/RegA family two-component response regulator